MCTGNCFRSELPSTRLGCEYERFRHTGRLRKAGMYPAFIYLSIYFVILLYFFRVSLECKDVED